MGYALPQLKEIRWRVLNYQRYEFPTHTNQLNTVNTVLYFPQICLYALLIFNLLRSFYIEKNDYLPLVPQSGQIKS